MKKFFYTALAVILMLNLKSAIAQVVTNAGFENWTPVANYMNPDNWNTSNATSVQFGFGATVARSDSSHSLLYAMQLQTGSFGGQQFPGVATNGVATIGIGTVNIVGGTSWVLRSSKMSGYFEYNSGNGIDSGLVTVILLKRTASGRDTIALGKKSLGAQVGYASFDVNLTYRDWWRNPDSVLIVIQSSKGLLAAQAGTWLRVDDISFTGNVPAGINTISTSAINVSVYPNPANDFVHFAISNINNAKSLNIFDILGKKIKSVEITSAQLSVSTEGLNNSLYFYQVADRNNFIISTGKFSVKK